MIFPVLKKLHVLLPLQLLIWSLPLSHTHTLFLAYTHINTPSYPFSEKEEEGAKYMDKRSVNLLKYNNNIIHVQPLPYDMGRVVTCGGHSWYCAYFKCRRGWSVKWGVGESGREKEEVYTIPVSLSKYYRLETPFSKASLPQDWQLLGGMWCAKCYPPPPPFPKLPLSPPSSPFLPQHKLLSQPATHIPVSRGDLWCVCVCVLA